MLPKLSLSTRRVEVCPAIALTLDESESSFMKPSTGPVLQLSVSPLLSPPRGPSSSVRRRYFFIICASEASASSSYPSNFSPSRPPTIFANYSCVNRRALAKAVSEAHSLPRYSFCSVFFQFFLAAHEQRGHVLFALGDAPAMLPFSSPWASPWERGASCPAFSV
jgi:hypothetical protein